MKYRFLRLWKTCYHEFQCKTGNNNENTLQHQQNQRLDMQGTVFTSSSCPFLVSQVTSIETDVTPAGLDAFRKTNTIWEEIWIHSEVDADVFFSDEETQLST